MKRSIVFLLVLCLFSSLSAKVELLESYQVGIDSYYRSYQDLSGPWTFFVLEIDVSNPYNTLKVVKANDACKGRETVKSMALRHQDEGHRVLGATNGDFYDIATGETRSSCVVDGEYVRTNNRYLAAFACTDLGVPMMLNPRNECSLIVKDSTDNEIPYTISTYNLERQSDFLCLYNSFMGNSTGTNNLGFECLATPIETWYVNDTISCVIEKCESNIGNMFIPDDKIVISGHGAASEFLSQHCHPGDTIQVAQNILSTNEKIEQLIGGGPTILRNSKNVVDESYAAEWFSILTCTERHPRTALGYNADSTHVYFVVVDGRQTQSIGMTLYELSDFMNEIGIVNGMNIDGGGSSTLLVRNALMNEPSDGGERADANGIICITTAPVGNLSHIQIPRDSVSIYKNKSIDVGITGWDENYNPKGIPSWDSINVDFDETMGSFTNNIFTAKEISGNCHLVADYHGESDSIIIHINELHDLKIYPETVTVDSVTKLIFEVQATNESGIEAVFQNDLFEFTILDSNIASINAEGEIIGKNTGETQVVVRYGGEYDTAYVSVEIGEGEVVVDEIENISDWTLSSDDFINDSETSIALVDRIAGSGSKALQVNYSRTGDEDGNIYLEIDPIDLYGVPSDILVDVLSDSIKHWIYVLLEDARGVDYSVKSSSSLRYNDDYRTQYLVMKNLLPADGEQLYPLKLKGIRLRIDDKATSGSLFVDRLRVIYPTWTALDEADIPSSYCLEQNYPNPFNPTTKIKFQLAEKTDVDLSVFDIHGTKVATLIKGVYPSGSYAVEFLANNLPTGVYVYRLQSSDWASTKKMLLIK